jgi:cyclophilin family peptidyl-prolyl cis-trans isomerase
MPLTFPIPTAERSLLEAGWLRLGNPLVSARLAVVVAWVGILSPAVLPADADEVRPISPELRRSAKLDPFYQKCTMVNQLPIVGSEKVSDFALLEAAYIVRHMLAGRPELIQALATNGVKIVVMAYNEYTTDLPEQRDMKPRVFWDSRARGLGGSTCSGAEENLLGYPGDPYSTENILIHEFGHVIEGEGMRALDPTFAARVKAAYQSATARGLWKNTYASSNAGEYWAECTQDWFDNNRHDDALHNHVHTRAMLKEYDPEAATLCGEVFGDNAWRYLKPMERPANERAHLTGFDPDKAPHFQWRKVPISEHPHVVIETTLGNIEVELEAKAAPLTVSNFLYYVQERLYNDGRFFRTVTPSNQPTNKVRIQVIQAQANPARTNEFLPPIRLERTSETGLHHLDGSLSMARSEPDTAQDSFSICIGDQPELDFGGKRNPDGQGFAAFGRVVKGMDLVRKIQAAPADGQQLSPPILIQRAIRLD